MKDCYCPQIEISGKDIIDLLRDKPHFSIKTMDILKIYKVIDLRDSVTRANFLGELKYTLKKYNIGEKDLLYAFPDSEGNLTIDGKKYKNIGSPEMESYKGNSVVIATFCLLERELKKRNRFLNFLNEKSDTKDKIKHVISKKPIISNENEVSLATFLTRKLGVIDKTCKKLIFTDGVEQISCRACQDCDNLTSVIFPKTLKIIHKEAFWGCTKLGNLKIPGNVKILGESSFAICKNLRTLIMERGLIKIGDFAFYGCDLRNIKIPGSVVEVGNQAFYQNNHLASVNIQDGVMGIGNGAFAQTIVNQIEVPSSMRKIEDRTFDGRCSKSINGNITYVPRIKKSENMYAPKEKVQEFKR